MEFGSSMEKLARPYREYNKNLRSQEAEKRFNLKCSFERLKNGNDEDFQLTSKLIQDIRSK